MYSLDTWRTVPKIDLKREPSFEVYSDYSDGFKDSYPDLNRV